MGPYGMIATLVHWAVSAFALLITAFLVPGFKVKNFGAALVASVIIGLANVSIGPVLLFLTLPLNVLTLGLFTFVVNGIVLKICAAILRDFTITSWFSAIIGACILALVGGGLHYLLV
jgi:putative membrane protein